MSVVHLLSVRARLRRIDFFHACTLWTHVFQLYISHICDETGRGSRWAITRLHGPTDTLRVSPDRNPVGSSLHRCPFHFHRAECFRVPPRPSAESAWGHFAWSAGDVAARYRCVYLQGAAESAITPVRSWHLIGHDNRDFTWASCPNWAGRERSALGPSIWAELAEKGIRTQQLMF